jgi:hypothetical protein
VSNFRVFACGWSAAYAVQFLVYLAGIGPERGAITMISGVIMAIAWGFSAVAMFGDRKPASPRP